MGQEDKIQKQESEVRSQNGSREDKIQLQRSGILIAEIRIKNRREKVETGNRIGTQTFRIELRRSDIINRKNTEL